MTKSNLPQPPNHLSPEVCEWWLAVVRDFALEPHHLRLLQSACESWDRAQQARAELAKHGGLTFRDKNGTVRAHPAVAMERDSQIRFARLVRELDLDAGAIAEAPRPPSIHSNRRNTNAG